MLKYCPNCIYSSWAGSASVTKPALSPTSPPTEQTRREHVPVLKWQLTPQTKLNNPQREHYSNNTQRPPLYAAALWQQISSGVRSDLITQALWTFIAHVIWATSSSATMNCLFFPPRRSFFRQQRFIKDLFLSYRNRLPLNICVLSFHLARGN